MAPPTLCGARRAAVGGPNKWARVRPITLEHLSPGNSPKMSSEGPDAVFPDAFPDLTNCGGTVRTTVGGGPCRQYAGYWCTTCQMFLCGHQWCTGCRCQTREDWWRPVSRAHHLNRPLRALALGLPEHPIDWLPGHVPAREEEVALAVHTETRNRLERIRSLVCHLGTEAPDVRPIQNSELIPHLEDIERLRGIILHAIHERLLLPMPRQ